MLSASLASRVSIHQRGSHDTQNTTQESKQDLKHYQRVANMTQRRYWVCLPSVIALKTSRPQVAEAIDLEDSKAAERLKSATTHWLRHTFGTMNANRNTPVQMIQASLGHSDVGTTGIYLSAERRQRAQVINQYFDEIAK